MGKTDDSSVKDEEVQKRRRNSAILQALCGGYLVYLGIKIIRDTITQGNGRWYYTACAVAFIVFGAVFAVFGIRTLVKKQPEGGNAEGDAASENDENAAAKNAAAGGDVVEDKAAEAAVAKNTVAADTATMNDATGNDAGKDREAKGKTADRADSGTPSGGEDIRERLRCLNEADGIETEDIGPDRMKGGTRTDEAADDDDTEEDRP